MIMNKIKSLTAIVGLSLLSACGGGSSTPQVTTCCQTTVCSLNGGKTWYDEYCGFISPVTKVTTIVGHPTPPGLICTVDKALYACK